MTPYIRQNQNKKPTGKTVNNNPCNLWLNKLQNKQYKNDVFIYKPYNYWWKCYYETWWHIDVKKHKQNEMEYTSNYVPFFYKKYLVIKISFLTKGYILYIMI